MCETERGRGRERYISVRVRVPTGESASASSITSPPRARRRKSFTSQFIPCAALPWGGGVWWHKLFIQTDMVLDELEEKDRVVYYSLGTLLYQSGDSYQRKKGDNNNRLENSPLSAKPHLKNIRRLILTKSHSHGHHAMESPGLEERGSIRAVRTSRSFRPSHASPSS